MHETIADAMSRDVVAVLPSDSAEEAARLMQQHDVGSIPVVSGGQLKGILTDRDIVLRCIAEGRDPKSVKAADVMSSELTVVTPQQTLQDAASIMATEQIRRLPVVQDGHLEGMISLADIARRHAGPELAEAVSEISSDYCGTMGSKNK